jgi:hypothetical protein
MCTIPRPWATIRKLTTCGAATLLLAVLCPGASAGLLQETGDLAAVLQGIVIAPEGSEGFLEPSAADLQDFAEVLQEMLAGNYATAASLADVLDYDLIEFSDTATGNVYYMLRERTSGGQPINGQGTYLLNPVPQRELNIQAPHAIDDTNTRPISIRMFLDLQTRFLEITGSGRCANAEASTCDGTTAACGSQQAYRVSDVAHFVECFFQVASDVVAAQYPDLVTVNVHGWTPCDPATATSLVVISNGTDGEADDGIAAQLAAVYNDLIPASYPGVGAGSCNVAAGDPLANVWPCTDTSVVCGQPNTQGRSINGSADPCIDGVAAAPLPERFIHLEQQRVLRDPPGGETYPGVSYQLTIDAFGTLFPPALWVDFYYAGAESGTYSRPYNGLTEAVTAATPGATIRIKAGTTSQAPTIADAVVLTSFGGSAVIGY